MRGLGRWRRTLGPAVALMLCVACGRQGSAVFSGLDDAPRVLSEFSLFAGDPASQQPAEGVIPYDLTTPLFSDYAAKHRFVRLPDGQPARWDAVEAFEFPVGTIIAKTFAYPVDMGDPGSRERLLETRILAHLEDGWLGLPYVWNEEQTEATLRIAGTRLAASWTDAAGESHRHEYLVPNANQCKGCHRATDRGTTPLGPKARYLHRDFDYGTGAGGVENQLAHWRRVGALQGGPELADAPRTPVWDDPTTGSLDARARAYLEINCAHCHNPEGPARTTGLDLTWFADESVDIGVYKFPVAAGRGSGSRLYGIAPGKPDESIMMYRMLSVDPGVMMPELGRRLVHQEGVELLRRWIEEMEEPHDREPPPVAGR